MRRKSNVVFGLLLLMLMLAGMAAQAEEADSEEYKIGVVVYDPDDPEMMMFSDYYRDYIAEGFSVKFYFSGAVDSAEQENEFIVTAAEAGVQGIISFYGADLPGTVAVCEENEVYYVLGSGTISDADYEEVKENPWFLGSVGPDPDDEYQAGVSMASYMAEQGRTSYLIVSGGASTGNFMHTSRVEGMLDTLTEKLGLELQDGTETAAASETVTTFANEDGSVSVTLSPGYLTQDGSDNLTEALAAGTYDAVMSAFYVYPFMDQIAEKESEQGSDIAVGTVDSFTAKNFELIQEDDAFGNAKINFVEGKYASMAGPAFAMMFNAISGHPEANTADGTAVRLYQGFWEATGRDEYIELYGYTTGIYENAYSNENLMQVIQVYNDETTPEDLKALTEAYTVEDVKARITE